MPFMQPETTRASFWHIDTSEGTCLVPADLFHAAGGPDGPPDADDIRDYIQGEPDLDDDGALDAPALRHGWYARLSAPGYMDATDWSGPHLSEARALIELANLHDICPLCWEQCYADGDGCGEPRELETAADTADAAATAELERERIECLFGLGGGELDDEPFTLGEGDDARAFPYTYEGAPDYCGESDLGKHPHGPGEMRTIIAYMDATIPGLESGGWRQLARFSSSGEADCWACGAGSGQEWRRPGCHLCEGDGLIYLGDGWAEHVIWRGPLAAYHAEFQAAIAHNLDGVQFFSVGACPGCESCFPDGDDGSDEAHDAASEGGFSWIACDSCGSSLGGDRYPAHGIIAETPEAAQADDATIEHWQVCVDCLSYHANGDLPNQTPQGETDDDE